MRAQSVPAREIVVIDDASTDRSVAVVAAFAARDASIRLLRNERNRGPLFSANRGLQEARGEYIYFASANDRVLPGLFEKSVRMLRRHPEAALCCSDFLIYYDPRTAFHRRMHRGAREGYYSPAEVVRIVRNEGTYVPGTSTILRRSALQESGSYTEGLGGHGDWFAHLAMAFRHGLCYIPEPLAAWRTGQKGSMSSRSRDWAVQKGVIGNLLAILKSDACRDVLPMFKSSGSLFFIPFILRGLLGPFRRHRDLLTPLLLRRAAWTELRRRLIGAVPLWGWRAYGRFRGSPVPSDLLEDGKEFEGSSSPA